VREVDEAMERWLAAAARLADTPPGTPEHAKLLTEVSEARQAYEDALARRAQYRADEHA
jgi:hypothetical protein